MALPAEIMRAGNEVEANTRVTPAGPNRTQVVGTGLAAGVAENVAHGAPLFPQSSDSVMTRSNKTVKTNANGSVVQFAGDRPLVAVLAAVLTGIICGRLLAH
jgi:hypothetical protein